MRKSRVIVLLIILISFAVGIYLYPLLPEVMASHWSIQGQVNGYMSKFWGVFLMPFILLGMFLLFIVIPKIDPLKDNIEKFRNYYETFIAAITFFLFYIYILTLLWNLGVKFDMNRFLIPGLGILFYYVGILVENAKRNWFIGIRTPWTLSSDVVWEKTHKIGGKLFKAAGIIALLGIFISEYTFFLIMIPVLSFSFYVIVYSYFEYQKEKR